MPDLSMRESIRRFHTERADPGASSGAHRKRDSHHQPTPAFGMPTGPFAVICVAGIWKGVDALLMVFDTLTHAFWCDPKLPEAIEANHITADFFLKHREEHIANYRTIVCLEMLYRRLCPPVRAVSARLKSPAAMWNESCSVTSVESLPRNFRRPPNPLRPHSSSLRAGGRFAVRSWGPCVRRIAASFAMCALFVLSSLPGAASHRPGSSHHEGAGGPQASGQQALPEKTGVPAGAQGSIVGHVFRADTDEPLAGIVVTLDFADFSHPGPRPGPLDAVRSDAAGAYRFTTLDPGRYRVFPRSNQFRLVGGVLPVTVGEGEAAQGPNFQMRPSQLHPAPPPSEAPAASGPVGSISGTVRCDAVCPGDSNDWMMHIAVLQRGSDGEPWSQRYRAAIDEGGGYRLENLPPGAYYVALTFTGPTMRLLGYHLLFYPSADTLKNAQAVQVKTNEETPGVDFSLVASPVFRVTVSVAGAKEDHFLIAIFPADWDATLRNLNAFDFPMVLSDANGVAKEHGIPAGLYRIQVMHAVINARGSAATDGGGPVGSAVIRVVDSDVTVQVPLSRFQ
jgi:hypothetical protein